MPWAYILNQTNFTDLINIFRLTFWHRQISKNRKISSRLSQDRVIMSHACSRNTSSIEFGKNFFKIHCAALELENKSCPLFFGKKLNYWIFRYSSRQWLEMAASQFVSLRHDTAKRWAHGDAQLELLIADLYLFRVPITFVFPFHAHFHRQKHKCHNQSLCANYLTQRT